MKVEQAHNRILRECLAKVSNSLPRQHFLQKDIVMALAKFAQAIGPYCECVDRSIDYHGMEACLDCGKRWQPGKWEPNKGGTQNGMDENKVIELT